MFTMYFFTILCLPIDESKTDKWLYFSIICYSHVDSLLSIPNPVLLYIGSKFQKPTWKGDSKTNRYFIRRNQPKKSCSTIPSYALLDKKTLDCDHSRVSPRLPWLASVSLPPYEHDSCYVLYIREALRVSSGEYHRNYKRILHLGSRLPLDVLDWLHSRPRFLVLSRLASNCSLHDQLIP